MPELRVDPSSRVAPFEQLRKQLIEQIMSRALPDGTKLPTVRALAVDLGLAANTVARTYRELEAEGYVITRGRSGTFVAPVAPATPEIRTEAARLTAAYVDAMRSLGMSGESILRAVRRRL